MKLKQYFTKNKCLGTIWSTEMNFISKRNAYFMWLYNLAPLGSWTHFHPLAPIKTYFLYHLWSSWGLNMILMYCNRLHAWWSTQSGLETLLSSLFLRQWIGLQTLWWFRLKHLFIDEMVRAWCFGCCQALWVLLVGFLFLWYEVLFTLSPSLCFLILFLYLDLYVLGDDALISFIETKHLCVLIHIWTNGEV